MAKQRGSSKSDTLATELDEINKSNAYKGTPKINLGDGASLKKALDDAAAEAVTSQGYLEDYTLSNVKLGVGLFTCSLAAIAQFYPKKYPDNFWILVACVGLYIAASLAHSALFSGIEGDVFFIAKQKGKSVLCIASKLPRYSEHYKLVIGSKQTKWSKGLDKGSATLEKSVTSYFDSEGALAENIFKADVLSALQSFERQSKKTK